MAYPFKPFKAEDLNKISRQVERLILALRKTKKRFVVSFPKNQIRIQNKTSVFE
jgi:hypothetical protein